MAKGIFLKSDRGRGTGASNTEGDNDKIRALLSEGAASGAFERAAGGQASERRKTIMIH